MDAALTNIGNVNKKTQVEHIEYTWENMGLHVIKELLISLNHIGLLVSIDIHSFLYMRKPRAKLLNQWTAIVSLIVSSICNLGKRN